ncbi:RHS repeat domain-containing protein [Siccibacter colletis]|uniref:RHS repeat domain-containing protein n=1 Tax=Siccibacter colletis TaxID=1505757 RepID=UPI000907206C|nr:RHS repeat-associated core domain-containing protein [Siccibacter colletis]
MHCDLRYPGQLYDSESGLFYNRHRYYDPEAEQYISPDPPGLKMDCARRGMCITRWVNPRMFK